MEPLIDTNSSDLLTSDAPPSIWDIENAEKLQFAAFIQEKMDIRFNQMFVHYEQMLHSLKEEHSKQLLMMQTELDETRQYVCHLQDKLTSQNNFVLIGWYSEYSPSGPTFRPIIVPVEFTWSTYDQRIHYLYPGHDVKLILSKLYETPARQLNLLVLMIGSYGQQRTTFVDDELNTILEQSIVDIGSIEKEKERYFRQNKQTIKSIEQQYPGLFDYPEHLKRELMDEAN